MTKTEILEYIQFRASGIGQAPNYTYKDFYNEIVEMQRNEVKKLTIPVVSVALKQGLEGAVEEVSKHLIEPKCVREGKVKRNER